MTTPRPSLLDLHPVEALLALLLISAAALLRLVTDPPRPIRRRKRFYALDEVDSFPVGVEARQVVDWKRQPLLIVRWIETENSTACAAAARVAAEQVDQQLRQVRGSQLQANAAPGPTVAELRTMARQRGILGAGSRPIHKARKGDLIAALGL